MLRGKAKIVITTIVSFIAIVVLGFMITSLALASEHGNTLTEEWKSWTAGEEVQEEVTEENTENEAENELNTADIEDYSNVEIVA